MPKQNPYTRYTEKDMTWLKWSNNKTQCRIGQTSVKFKERVMRSVTPTRFSTIVIAKDRNHSCFYDDNLTYTYTPNGLGTIKSYRAMIDARQSGPLPVFKMTGLPQSGYFVCHKPVMHKNSAYKWFYCDYAYSITNQSIRYDITDATEIEIFTRAVIIPEQRPLYIVVDAQQSELGVTHLDIARTLRKTDLECTHKKLTNLSFEGPFAPVAKGTFV
jgi:hypothetical protein